MKQVTSFLLLLFFLISTVVYSQGAGSGLTKSELEKAKLAQVQQADQAPGTYPGQITYTDDNFDLQFEYPVDGVTYPGQAGIETDGTYIYTTDWQAADAGKFYAYSLTGTFAGQITVPGLTSIGGGIRDMAFDGTYFYGSPATTTTYQFTLNGATLTGSLIGQWVAPTAARAIAYNATVDGFYANNWSTPIILYSRSGANLGSMPTVGDESYYGFAWDPQGPYLWGYSQKVGTSQNMLYKLATPGGAVLESFDMLTILTIPVAGTDIAGGAFFKANLVQGTYTLGGLVQNKCFWGVEMGTTGPPPTIDVGVTAFVTPVSGPNLGNETVKITVKNFGANPASNIPVSYTLDGGAAVNGVLAGPIASGATADFTFPGTVNLSNPGQTYVFVACTALTGDVNAGNNCKTQNVTHVIPTYCDASTTTEDEYIANVLCGTINNSSGWQGGVANYTNITTTINQGMSEPITITNGNAWAADIVYCWVDWNKDFTFGTGEELFMLTNVGGTGATFTGAIATPANTPDGEYRMRIRMTYSTAPTPCGNASYGEVEDYTITVGGGGPTLNPPQNLAGIYLPPNSAVLTWEAPEENGEWLGFCGPNDGGLGLEGGGSFFVSAHWTQAQVAPYVGFYLTKVSIFPTSTDNATYVLKIWTGVSGATLVHNQPLNGLVFDEWNDIIISTPLMIPNSDCWVGYEVTHNDGDNPAGIDAGPAVAGSGDMVSFDGTTWESLMNTYGLDYNFNIEVFVTEDADGQVAQPLPNKKANILNQSNKLVANMNVGGNSGEKSRATLTGYNIYRDDVMIGSTGVAVLTYTDAGLAAGTYSYTVKAVYDEGLSAAAGPVSVIIPPTGNPTIAVNPTTLNENHQVPGTITTKTVTVSNIGIGTLDWNLTVNTSPVSNAVNPTDSPEAIALLQAREAQDGIAPTSLGFDPLGSRVPAGYKPADLKGLRGEIAYGNNVEGNTFYSLDVQTLQATVIGSTTYAAFCGDFAPGDVDNMYIIDYNDDVLKMVDISTGVATPIASVPCPMAPNGIWTELAIDKTTGIFYATATDINVSNLYEIDPNSGAITLIGNTGIAAIISCTIDLAGTMYAFDIVSDNTYTVDLATGVGTLLGPAGFNGNYAQGMGYDPVNDKVYLAAYSTFAELRELNTTTGATTALGALPGETGAFGFPYQGGPQPGVDVGVTAFVSPVSGPYLSNETVTIKVKNFGTNSVSNIPVSYTLDGGAAVTGTLAGPIASGATADFTFPGTVNLGNPGQTYVFVGCTALAGDENSGNNCKTANVTNVIPTYCPASTQVEDEYIANVLCGDINNSSGWQGGVADYTAISTQIDAGMSEDITITNGNAWASDIVYCWADWNKDFTFGTGDEQYMLTNVGGTGQTFTGTISVPAGVPNGEYRFRIRMTYSTAPVPCGDATYGEVEDYTIVVGGVNPTAWLSADPLSGTIAANSTQTVTVTLNSETLAAGTYTGSLVFSAPANPATITVPVTLTVSPTGGAVIAVNPGSFLFELYANETETQTMTVSNSGTSTLNCTMSITYDSQMPVFTSFDVEAYRGSQSTAYQHAEARPENTPSGVNINTTDAMWDLQFSAPAGDASGEAGIETDGNFIYTTKWNGAGFFKYEMDGTYIGPMTVGSVQGIRDLAFDGTYMYGGAAATTVYKMDFSTQTLIGQFTAPTAVRAIAYDYDEDGFYANNWSTPIVLFDMSGATLNTLPTAGDESYYGFAYDNNNGSKHLYGFSQKVGLSGGVIFELALPGGTPTGVSHDVVTELATPGTDLAGGLFTCNNWFVNGTTSIGGLVQNVVLFAYELHATQGPVEWLSLSTYSASVNAGGSANVGVICNTDGFPPEGELHYASIWIANNSTNNQMVEIPVTLDLLTIGIDDASGDSYIMMYPNPTTDFVNIKSNSNINQVRIFNQAGQLVLSQEANGYDVRVETNNFNTGTYFVEISSAAGVVTSKLIVK